MPEAIQAEVGRLEWRAWNNRFCDPPRAAALYAEARLLIDVWTLEDGITPSAVLAERLAARQDPRQRRFPTGHLAHAVPA